jgi:hypothetical protein
MTTLRTLSVAAFTALAFASIASAQAPGDPPPAPSPAPSPAPAPVPGAPAGSPAAPQAAQPGQPKPYKDVLKGAKAIPGFFTLHQKDEKVWIEIRPDQFDKPFFFSYNIPRSIGERGLYGSQMGDSNLAVFKKIGNQVQIIARNTEFFAPQGTPQAQFVSESFSDSLLASAAVASAPHPETKAVIVEANALLFADIPGYLTRLETAFRMPFALDAKNTSISAVSNVEHMTGIQVNAHFAVPKLAAPPLMPPPVPTPPPPKATPDPRSLFVGFQYSFARLPAEPMRARLADERVGYFTTSRVDYTDDTDVKPRVQIANRWRLEKKDPAAAVSEPKEPVVYWLDKNIPEKYRKAVADGVLEWNKAFEKAGIRNALVVKQQGPQDSFDTMDARHASVRWFTGADVGFAIGPSQVDPRSGEIMDADIGMSDVFARGARRVVVEDLGRPVLFDPNEAYVSGPLRAHKGFLACNYGNAAAQELHFAMDLLEARGIEMGGPEAEALAQDYVKDVIMHEVGHTLGLRHNFRASTVYSLQQVQDPAFTRANGVTTSVMDYTPYNIAPKGEKQGEYVMSTLGPYDYWAIEYGYKTLDPAREKDDLAKIASRSAEPQLAFATDEDAGYGSLFVGIDPDVNRFDLGSDPMEYYKRQMKLSRELWDRLQDMKLPEGESYERLTRSFASGFRSVGRVAPLAAKYVGGVTTRRDRAGTGRALFEPVPAARQREALTLIANDFFREQSFRFKPEFLGRLAIDQYARPVNPDISLAGTVLNVQRSVLDQLMSDPVAARLVEAPEKSADRTKAFRLSELYDTLQNVIWSEARTGQETSMIRRNLQREHLKRVAGALVKPSAALPADARSLLRENARSLAAELRAARAKPGLSKETRAHFAESLNTLEEALKAPLQRAGV